MDTSTRKKTLPYSDIPCHPPPPTLKEKKIKKYCKSTARKLRSTDKNREKKLRAEEEVGSTRPDPLSTTKEKSFASGTTLHHKRQRRSRQEEKLRENNTKLGLGLGLCKEDQNWGRTRG